VYGGISGGDDNKEMGFSLEIDSPIRDDLSLNLILDSSFNNEDDNDLLYAFLEGVWEHEVVDITGSYEHEWTEFFRNRISTLRLSRRFENGLQASLDGAYETVDDEDSRSARLAFNWDYVPDILSFSGSFNHRHTETSSTVSEQLGMNVSISRNHFLSIQSTFNQPDRSDDLLEINLLIKF
jgi:outer membrane usher protein FimD/PapC